MRPREAGRGNQLAMGASIRKRWNKGSGLGFFAGWLTLTLAVPATARDSDRGKDRGEDSSTTADDDDSSTTADDEDDDSAFPDEPDERETPDAGERCCCCDEACAPGQGSRTEELRHRVSLTFSPLHLLYPIFELTAEVRAAPHLGAGLVVGTGRMATDTTDAATGREETVVATAQEWGGFVAFYPSKPFRGIHLGAELLYTRVDADELNGVAAKSANGLAMGPFVGYKLMTKIGFTAVAQVGGQYVSARSEERSSAGTIEEKAGTEWAPLMNFNLGWSF